MESTSTGGTSEGSESTNTSATTEEDPTTTESTSMGDDGSSSDTTGAPADGSDGTSGRVSSSGGAEDGSTGADASETAGTMLPFVVTSPAFEGLAGCGPGERGVESPDGDPDACDLFPAEHVGTSIGGDNVSPPLRWENPPEGTASFVVVLHDLSYRREGDPFTHWILWNLPAELTGVPEGVASGPMPEGLGPDTRQLSYQAGNGYAGPGAAGNVYEFVVYALGDDLFTPSSLEGMPARVTDLVHAELDDRPSILGTARLRVRSSPPAP